MKDLGLSPEDITRETGYALQIVNSSKKLQTCPPGSVLSAIISAASTGLTLNPAVQHACLIPRWSRDGTVCEFQPMYRGLMFLAVQEGAATKFNVQAVHRDDEFEATPDNDQRPVHHKFNGFKRGPIIGYYSVATMLDGTKTAEFMGVDDIHEVRKNSDGYKYAVANNKTHPWIANESEMARKTVVKRHVKRLPSGKADSRLYAAIEVDNNDYTVETVEVPVKAISKPELTPDHEQWENAISQVAKGVTKERARKSFTITDENWALLVEGATALDLAQTA